LLNLFTSSDASLPAFNNDDPPHLLIAAALAGGKAKPLENEVQRLRVVKSERELRLMKKAADMSAAAHTEVDLPITLGAELS
jgi:intermediate cleaving peptidase 55